MKKNLLIIVLFVACVMLFCAYNGASKERSELKEALQYEKVNHDILKRQIKKTGLHLYDTLGKDFEYAENLLWLGSRSICDDAQCIHVDWNGDLSVSQFYGK